MYIRGSVLGKARFFHTGISPISPLIVTGEREKCEIWPQCSAPLAFVPRPHFEMEQDKWNIKQNRWAPMRQKYLCFRKPKRP